MRDLLVLSKSLQQQSEQRRGRWPIDYNVKVCNFPVGAGGIS